MKLSITDNAFIGGHEGWPLDFCVEDPSDFALKRSQIISDLGIIEGKKLSELLNENPDLLVFPYSLGAHNDDIGSLGICSLNRTADRLYTGNLMGFVGVNDTQLSIKSRFASEADNHFLHYMLMRVFCPNVFRLNHESTSESVFDFLLYMFPHFFNAAMRQGVFKEYRRVQHNDLKLRGTIDISRHISSNLPFNARVAYNASEHSYDNHITQLVRHTIEFIKASPLGGSILQDKETRANIRTLAEATASYSRSDLKRILLDNRRPLNHPYFTKYMPLQRLCVSILKRNKLKYGSEKDKVYGILFDGAWLWEEFLNTIFKDWGMLHAENKTGKNPIYLFEGNSYIRYPDFYRHKTAVIDAKYKRIGGKEIARDDIHQLITYLHVLGVPSAYIAYPKTTGETAIDTIGILKGMHGEVGLLGLKIPQGADSFRTFCEQMNGLGGEIQKLSEAWAGLA